MTRISEQAFADLSAIFQWDAEWHSSSIQGSARITEKVSDIRPQATFRRRRIRPAWSTCGRVLPRDRSTPAPSDLANGVFHQKITAAERDAFLDVRPLLEKDSRTVFAQTTGEQLRARLDVDADMLRRHGSLPRCRPNATTSGCSSTAAASGEASMAELFSTKPTETADRPANPNQYKVVQHRDGGCCTTCA
jgi:hypothetical protein